MKKIGRVLLVEIKCSYGGALDLTIVYSLFGSFDVIELLYSRRDKKKKKRKKRRIIGGNVYMKRYICVRVYIFFSFLKG